MKSDIIGISNEYLDVKIDLFGGALHSVIAKNGGEQLLWQGDPAAWDRRDLVLFPFIGRQKDSYYLFNGNRFDSELHGFAKDTLFNVAEINETELSVPIFAYAQICP